MNIKTKYRQGRFVCIFEWGFLFQATLRKFFPSWAEIEKHREVVSFTCELLDDPRPLVDHVYEAFTQNQLEKMQDAYLIDVEPSLLESLYHESKVSLPGEPLHNKHLNYYKHPDDELMERLSNRFYKGKDTRPVHVPSRLHAFLNINDYIEVRVEDEEDQNVSMKDDDRKPECAIFVNEPDTTVGKNLLSVCNEISQHQDVTDLWLNGVQCGTMLETGGLALSSNATSFIMESSSLPPDMLNRLMERVSQSSFLKFLNIQSMSLKPLKSLIISNKKYLQHLELKGTSLNPDLCQSICEQLENVEHLKQLDLSHNNLNGPRRYRSN